MRPHSVWAPSSVCQCLISLPSCHLTSTTFFLTVYTIDCKAINGSASTSPNGLPTSSCCSGLRLQAGFECHGNDLEGAVGCGEVLPKAESLRRTRRSLPRKAVPECPSSRSGKQISGGRSLLSIYKPIVPLKQASHET